MDQVSPISGKAIASLLLPFAVLVGVCHSYGYWGHFDVDALQFVSVLDVAKLSIYPLLLLAITNVLVMIYAEVGFGDLLPPGGGANSRVGRFARKYWRGFVVLVICLIVYVALNVPHPARWYVIGVLASVLSPLLTHIPALIELIPNAHLRSPIAGQLVLIPFLAIAVGKNAAMRAESGDAALLVDAPRSGLSLSADLSSPVSYLGKLGDTVFLFETKSRRLILMKPKDEAPIVLRRRDG